MRIIPTINFLQFLLHIHITLIVRLQRNFLWGGVRGASKIAWVSRAVVCKHKSAGGLGWETRGFWILPSLVSGVGGSSQVKGDYGMILSQLDMVLWDLDHILGSSGRDWINVRLVEGGLSSRFFLRLHLWQKNDFKIMWFDLTSWT
jgi:hypothetical protein